MRIALIITRADEYGGAQNHVAYIATYLKKINVQFDIICGSHGDFARQLEQLDITVINLPALRRDLKPLHDIAALYQFVCLQKTKRYSLIAVHSSKAGFVGALAGRITATPVVFTAHSWPFLQGRTRFHNCFFRLLSRITCKAATKIICVCAHDKQVALETKLARPSKFVMIRNGIPDATSTERCSTPETTSQNLCAVMVARFAHPKDHDTVLNALANAPGVVLTLVGDGPLRQAIQEKAYKMNLTSRIVFTGEISNPEHYISKSDVVILTSHSEGLPLSLLEGLRAGKPLIASRVGGVSEIIDDGVEGFLVNRGDYLEIAAKLALLGCDPALRLEMGRYARQRYRNNFSLKQMLDEVTEVYLAHASRP